MQPQSILVIGSTGRTGVNLIQQVAQLNPQKKGGKIAAFCRDPSRLDVEAKKICDDIVTGDARKPEDIQRAIEKTQADCIFVAIGGGEDLSKKANHIRTENAKALVQVLRKPAFDHVRVVVISSLGAGDSKIIVGFGIGSMLAFHLRHVLSDHTGQEAALLAALKDRILIVRPTALTEYKSTGKIFVFGDTEKPPTTETDRLDLARFVVQDVVYGKESKFGAHPINLTGIKA